MNGRGQTLSFEDSFVLPAARAGAMPGQSPTFDVRQFCLLVPPRCPAASARTWSRSRHRRVHFAGLQRSPLASSSYSFAVFHGALRTSSELVAARATSVRDRQNARPKTAKATARSPATYRARASEISGSEQIRVGRLKFIITVVRENEKFHGRRNDRFENTLTAATIPRLVHLRLKRDQLHASN